MTAFPQAAAALMDTLKRAAGQTVTYRRGSDAATFTAVPGQSLLELSDGDGRVIQFTSSDWLIEAVNLQLAGQPATPERGDTIEHQANGKTITYEVLDPPFKPMDAGATAFRVYTKRIRIA